MNNICSHCQTKIDGELTICPNCGEPVNATLIRLTCRSCGAVMEADPERKTMICPYCGAKQLIRESDAVKLAKLKADTEKEKLRAQTEQVRLAGLEREKEKAAETRKASEAYRKSFRKVWTIICMVVCFFMGIASVSNDMPIAAVIAFVQTGLFLLSWLFGMQIIPEKRPQLRRLPALIAYGLIIPFFLCWGFEDVSLVPNEPWPESGIVTRIPQPEGNDFKYNIISNSASSFYANVRCSDKNEMAAYIREYAEQCQEYGFVRDPDIQDIYFTGFDSEGYELKVRDFSNINEMTVSLDAPLVMSSLTWTTDPNFAQVPVPDSRTGILRYERGNHYTVIIGDTDYQAFEAYVQRCKDAGFDKNYVRTAYRLDAYTENSDKIRVEYIGQKRMEIDIQLKLPEETKEE